MTQGLSKNIVFLFGAGASYGCGGTRPERPPLGFQLFNILRQNYPASWGALPEDVSKVFDVDFEQGMQLIYERFGGAIPALMREMAVYFIQFRPVKRATLYDHLIRDLENLGALSKTIFSTLNYECILEFSLVEQGHEISYFDEGDAKRVPIWKLHGSCNMFAHGVTAGPGVSYGTGVTWEGGIQAFLDSNRVVEHCLVESGLAPVMCLYMRGKPLNVSPSVIRQLQGMWETKIRNAAAVVCIGVRPLIEDAHIWEPLAAATAPLLFVGDEASLRSWSAGRRKSPTEYLGSTFRNAYPLILERVMEHGA